MDRNAYREEIRLRLTGQLLELELSDATLDAIVNAAFRELQRYIDTTKVVTIPYKRCINMKEFNVSSVSRVFRAEGYTAGTDTDGNVSADPMYMAQWQMLSGNGSLYNISDWTYNYAAYNTALQVRNTMSTDLLFRYDRTTQDLYINCSFDNPEKITVEFVPRLNDVSEIVSDFWIDMQMKLSVALAKETVGRVRSRYNQTNALWQGDGDKLLEEGRAELAEIREQLRASSQLVYPVD